MKYVNALKWDMKSCLQLELCQNHINNVSIFLIPPLKVLKPFFFLPPPPRPPRLQQPPSVGEKKKLLTSFCTSPSSDALIPCNERNETTAGRGRHCRRLGRSRYSGGGEASGDKEVFHHRRQYRGSQLVGTRLGSRVPVFTDLPPPHPPTPNLLPSSHRSSAFLCFSLKTQQRHFFLFFF